MSRARTGQRSRFSVAERQMQLLAATPRVVPGAAERERQAHYRTAREAQSELQRAIDHAAPGPATDLAVARAAIARAWVLLDNFLDGEAG